MRLTEEELIVISREADGSDLYFARSIESAVLRKVAELCESKIQNDGSVDTGKLWRNGTLIWLAEQIRAAAQEEPDGE